MAKMENEAVRFEGGGAPGRTGSRNRLHSEGSAAQRASARVGPCRRAGAAHAQTVHTGESRGVKQAGFMVLTTARRPAILVELGYSTNPQDGQFLTTRSSQKAMAAAIADAIVAYLLEYERKTNQAGLGGAAMIGDRRTARVLLQAGLAASLLGGCVYYNGMYNANRLANSARKAEREGRTFEANNLWGQVATKAESVVVRHPKSKYAEEAAILGGWPLRAWVNARRRSRHWAGWPWPGSAPICGRMLWLATGRCQVSMGSISAADAAFAQVTDSKNSWRRREARFLRAQTLRYPGRYEEALAALEGIREPRAVPERLLSLAGAGRVPEAMALADSLVAQGDTTQPWDSLLVTLGRQDPLSGSNLVDRVRKLPNRPA